jgi:hypothetical protein
VREDKEEMFALKIVKGSAELVRELLLTQVTPLGADPVPVVFKEVDEVA